MAIAVDTATPPNVYVTGADAFVRNRHKCFPTKVRSAAWGVPGRDNAGGTDVFVTQIQGILRPWCTRHTLGDLRRHRYGMLGWCKPADAYVTVARVGQLSARQPSASGTGSVTATNAFVAEINCAGSLLTYPHTSVVHRTRCGARNCR